MRVLFRSPQDHPGWPAPRCRHQGSAVRRHRLRADPPHQPRSGQETVRGVDTARGGPLMDRDRDDDPRRPVERGRGRDLLGSDRHDPPAGKFDPAEFDMPTDPPPSAAGPARGAADAAQAHSFFRSEEHTSELQSLMRTSYAVFCWRKKNYLILLHPIDRLCTTISKTTY